MPTVKPKGRRRDELTPERIRTLQMWCGFLDNFTPDEQRIFEQHFAATPEGQRYAARFVARARAWQRREDKTISRLAFQRRWDADNPI